MRGGRYWCLDPQGGEQRLTPERAPLQLHEAAFSLHAGFGDGPVTLAHAGAARPARPGQQTCALVLAVRRAAVGCWRWPRPWRWAGWPARPFPRATAARCSCWGWHCWGSALATALFEVTRGIAHVRIESRLESALQAGIWDRLLRLPVPFFPPVHRR
jgi:hypothetical protein